MNTAPHYAWISLLLITLGACSTASPPPAQKLENKAETSIELVPQKQPTLSQEIFFGVLLGDIAVQRGNFPLASRLWLDVAQRSHNIEAVRRALEIAFASAQFDDALAATKLWIALEPEAKIPRQARLALLIRTGRFKAMEEELSAWLASRPEDAPMLFLQFHTLWPAEIDWQQVTALTQSLAKHYQDLPEAHLAIAIAADHSGQQQQALQAVDKALALRPDWESAILLRANILQKLSLPQSIDYLQGVTQRLATKKLLMALARMLANDKRYEESLAIYQTLAQTHPDDADIVLSEAMTALQGRLYARAESALKHALTLVADQVDSLHYYLGLVCEEQWRLHEAVAWYNQVHEGDFRLHAQIRLAKILARLGQRDAALNIVKELGIQQQNPIHNLQLAAQVWQELNDVKHAIVILNNGLERYPDQADLLYDRALLFEQSGDIVAAEKDLRRYITHYPDNPLGLNALGYTLANHTTRFDEAEALIRRALTQEPDNPVILDSLGWLLFRRGQLDDAIKYLEQAFTSMPDPEISAHYGEALWQAGRFEQARQVWSQGERLAPHHKLLRNTISRLTGK